MKNLLGSTHSIFRAFADETRLRLLNLLLERELCVCELCEVLDLAQPNASRHLSYLRRAGLVTVRQQGKWKHYAVPNRPQGLERTLLHCVKSCLREIDVLQRDLDRLRDLEPGGRCAHRSRTGPT